MTGAVRFLIALECNAVRLEPRDDLIDVVTVVDPECEARDALSAGDESEVGLLAGAGQQGPVVVAVQDRQAQDTFVPVECLAEVADAYRGVVDSVDCHCFSLM